MSSLKFLTTRHFSLTTAIIMKVVYGYDVSSENDRYIEIAEGAVKLVSDATVLGAMLINIIPACMPSFLPFFRCPLVLLTVQYIPEWFPGASFQRLARKCRELIFDMQTLPLDFAKRNMASLHPLI